MRSRLLAVAATLVLALFGVVVPAGPAAAHCGGHGIHPDLYNGGGISFRDGARIRRYPHITCDIVLGLGYPSHGIDVHCGTLTGTVWFYVRDTTTGVQGWTRWDALSFPPSYFIPDCVNG